MKRLCAHNITAGYRIAAKNNSRMPNLMSRSARVACYALVAFMFLVGCAPPFSAMQSAKLAGRGNYEITPFFSTVSFSVEDQTEHMQNEYGIQAAYGLADGFDLQLRYEFISFDYYDPYFDSISSSANVIGVGPKARIYRDIIAFCSPIGFGFGNGIDEVSETWQFHPTLIITLPIGDVFELNPSGKVLIPISGDQDILLAFNFGAGISANLRKWAIRPELGFLISPGDDGHFTHFSIGITIYP